MITHYPQKKSQKQWENWNPDGLGGEKIIEGSQDLQTPQRQKKNRNKV